MARQSAIGLFSSLLEVVIALVAALAVHRFIGGTQTLADRTGVRLFTPDEFGAGSD